MRAATRTRLTLAGIVAGGAALRLVSLGAGDLWLDELFTAEVARAPTLGALFERLAHDITPPLLYLLARLSRGLESLLGFEASVRLPSALAGIVAIAVVYGFVRGRVGAKGGLVAAALCAVHSAAVHHSREARFYALVVCLAAALHLLADRLRRRWRVSDAVGLGVVGGALGLTHTLAVSLVFAQFVPLAFVAWRTTSGERWPRLRRLGLAVLCTAVLLIPLGWLLSSQVGAAFSGPEHPTTLQTVEGMAKFLSGAGKWAREPVVLVLPLAAFGCWVGWKGSRDLLLVGGLAGLIHLVLFRIVPPDSTVHPRYFAFLLPILLFLVAQGALGFARRADRKWGRRAAGRVLAGVAAVLVLGQVRAVRDGLNATGVPYTDAVAWLNERVGERGRVLLYFHGARGPSAAVAQRAAFGFYATPALRARFVDPFTLDLDAPSAPTLVVLTLRPRHARALEGEFPGAERPHPRLLLIPAGPAGESTRAAVLRLAKFDRGLPMLDEARWTLAFGRWTSHQPPR